MATPVLNRPPAWDALLSAAHAWHFRPIALRAHGMRDRCLSLLSKGELARYTQFRMATMREEYLAAWVLCRTVLSRYTGIGPSEWRFEPDVHGKPTIIEPDRFRPFRFNLTHTPGLVVCIVSRVGEVGVDAEQTSQTVDPSLVARHFFSRRQQARFAALSSRERTVSFFEQWVLKEAYVKAIGKGLAYSPERLTVEQGDDGQPVAFGNCQFSLHRPTSDHVAAAAILRRDCAAPVSIDWLRTRSLLDGFG
jgi:4'-phosphopantetheinyl transferase